MCLVHKQPVHAQFLKGNGIILRLIVQLFQLCFQVELGGLHPLDAPFLCLLRFCFLDGGHDFINLILDHLLLPLRGKRNLLKL